MLKVKFWRIGTVVVGKSLEQDESLRAGGGGRKELGETHYKGIKYEVRSTSFPEISDTRLYVKGDKVGDDKIYASKNFDTEKDAKNYITAMNKIIHDINIEGALKKGCSASDEEVEVTIAE